MMASDLPTELLVTILGHCDPVTLCHSRCVQGSVKLTFFPGITQSVIACQLF